MSDIVIKADNLGKKYTIGHQAENGRYTALRDVLMQNARSLWHKTRDLVQGKPIVQGDALEEVWALKDVSFEIRRGEVVGIIGRNGAGKSTLLKILSRITEPSAGRVTIKGRVASLLEVGTGFHLELTGRENIFLNGAILGMTRAEIKKKFDEIVAFAEVEKFLDTPVKWYSSGMYVRLAFAVAAHLEPEILVVDEVLAVGDAWFQKKSLGKMSDIAQGGRTVLFVSHNMSAIRTLCQRGIILDTGRKVFDGATSAAIHAYSRNGSLIAGSKWTRPKAANLPPVAFEEIYLSLLGEQPRLRLYCDMRIWCRERSANSFVAVDICEQTFSPIMQAMPESTPFITGVPGVHRVQLEIDLPALIPGNYIANFWVGSHHTATFDYVGQALGFEVLVSPSDNRSFPHSSDHGCIVPTCRYTYSVQSPRPAEGCIP
jgi:lipopolysaccharide transport system ATP-binding protein